MAIGLADAQSPRASGRYVTLHRARPGSGGQRHAIARTARPPALLGLAAMASVHSESLPQRLAAIREQLQLLADYL
jgi:hypothetical protein